MNHAVQIVGYNLEGNVPYWVVKNQWGISFGELGYVRVKYGENMCGENYLILDPGLSEGVLCNYPCWSVGPSVRGLSLNISDTAH